MRIIGPVAAATLLLGACGSAEEGPGSAQANEGAALPAAMQEAPAAPAAAGAPAEAARWDLQSSGGGVTLALLSGSRQARMRLSCSAGKNLFVEVPGFQPVGSEDRLSFGSGGEVVALVVAGSPRGSSRSAGGVGAAGQVPDNLSSLVAGPLSASYGAQTSGPHPAPPPALARALVVACGRGSAAAPDPPESPPVAGANPCLMQGSERLEVKPLRAAGTEPFWAARIEGRCVTYSHPEDQKGTRVWTRYAPAPGGGVWSGTLAGRRFELRTRAAPGCSDGMSDKSYPIAVELLVGGEQRRGCAAPL